MGVHCVCIIGGGSYLPNITAVWLSDPIPPLLFCTCSVAPFFYIFGAVSLNVLRIILTTVAKCE